MSTPIPYCGLPPVPAALWQQWNLDPPLLATLAALGLGYAWAARRAGLPGWRRAAFGGGWLGLVVAFVSPLCALGVALFAARVGQHMLLVLVCAPLLVLGRPLAALRTALRGDDAARAGGLASARAGSHRFGAAATHARSAPRASVPGAAGGAAAFALLLWGWHAPGPYDLTFASGTAYWAMHLALLGAAVLLWQALLADRALGALLASLATMVQMGLLGAVLTFASRPLYASHLLATAPWGVTPLADQQLGGVLMWVPGGLVFLLVAVVRVMRLAAPPPAVLPQRA